MEQTTSDTTNKSITVAPATLMPALCLDLDGTVRHSTSGVFISGPDDIALYPDAEERIWIERDTGHLIIGITNQGGVAAGFKTFQQNDAEIDATIALFARNPFHILKCCLHLETGSVEPYCHRSLLRKPSIGMLALAESDAWDRGIIIDWDHSLMVGDREEDRMLAENAGIGFEWAWSFFGRPQPDIV